MNKKQFLSGLTVAGLLLTAAPAQAKWLNVVACDEHGKNDSDTSDKKDITKDEKKKEGEGRCGEGGCAEGACGSR